MRRTLPVAFAISLLLAVPGVAQTPDTAVVPLDSVLVEALRTTADVERAPVAATVVTRTGAAVARPGRGLEEMLERIPGVQVDNRFNYAVGERISIRGFGARAQFGVRGVRVTVDGVPATFADGQSAVDAIDPAEVQRAEVLRGTASSLYGNAAGGVIFLQSAPPGPQSWRLQGRMMGGADGFRQYRVGVDGTAGAVGYALRHSGFSWDGFRDHSDAWRDQTSLQLRIPALGGEVSLTGRRLAFDARNPGSLAGDAWRTTPEAAFPFNVVQGAGKDGVQTQGGIRWTRRLAGGELDLSTYLIDRDITNPITTTIIKLDRSAGGVRGLYALGDGPFRLAVGADSEWQRDDRRNFQNQQGSRGALVLDQRERVRAFAPFGRVEIDAGVASTLSAGVRYDRSRFLVDDRREGPEEDASGSRRMGAWSPALGIVTRMGAATTLFASWSTAFETPTTTELANRPDEVGGFNPELEPQLARTLEAGVRTSGRVTSAEAVAFHTSVRNALVPFEVEGAPGRNFFRNAGAARHQGIELSLRYDPASPISLEATYGATDARFRRFEVEGEDLAGNRVPGVALHRASGLARWGAGWGDAEVEARWRGRVPVDDANREEAPSHLLLDLNLAARPLTIGGATFRPLLSLTNLLDRAYVASVVPNAFGGRFYEPGPGRRLYLGAAADLRSR
jgi:iron complex outermembrane recepter protein